MLLLNMESSTTNVVSLTKPRASAAFCSNSSLLSKARSIEASFYFLCFDGLASLGVRLLLPKQKQQLFDSVINLKSFIILLIIILDKYH